MKIKFNPKSSGSASDIIYLLDEPGSYLHPSAQEKLCDMIKGISNNDGTVIYCTHTHHLLDPKYIPPKFIYLVQKSSNKIISITKINELKTLTKKESELQPVYEALGICDWDYFSQNQKLIALEGIYDKYALEIFTDIRKHNDYVLMPCSNAEAAFNQIPKFIAYGKKYAVIWDNDEEGIKYWNKAITAFKQLEEHKFLLLPNKKGKKKVRMEEMFENDDISKLAESLGLNKNTSYENVLVTIIASNDTVIKKCKETISKETLDNFEQLSSDIEYIFNGKRRIIIEGKELILQK
jgi:predicted ATP-dependent endonuclease of OLD family